MNLAFASVVGLTMKLKLILTPPPPKKSNNIWPTIAIPNWVNSWHDFVSFMSKLETKIWI